MSTRRMNRRTVLGAMAVAPAAMGLLSRSLCAAEPNQESDQPKVLMPVGDATEATDTLYPY